ncbi:MAG: MarR family transcriptional regulator [Candidatus Aenigmarchaeota archaeon]|nr:MarR family transcriptional regulator [Candidatus Aenigmarchaeota archaeon]
MSNDISQGYIRSKTGLSKRAVKYALAQLVSLGLISARGSFQDRRRKVYFLNENFRGDCNGNQ